MVNISCSSEGLSTSPGLLLKEAYCLIVWVTHNADLVWALDWMISAHVWSELIAQDICTHQLDAPAGTSTMESLSDVEFLLFKAAPCG